ncbi:hypothetical protein [Dictyobacter arantiisoli]|uniref:hypothetical protein n=1 Tax=Dictyobacter arantiisoli TaxID=2014874 RepID=UPI0011EF5785|nr:hypothetical protein [Dictyobacter arantiisoli]
MSFKTRFICSICCISLCLLTLVACGQGQSQASVPTSQPPTRGSTLGTPSTSDTPRIHPTTTIKTNSTATPAQGSRPAQGTNPAQGIAQIKLDKTAYSTHDIIQVTVTNHQTQSMYITSPQSSCSMVRIEIQINQTWVRLGRCIRIPTTNPIRRLAPGASLQQSLRPEMLSGGSHPTTTSWQAGTYRIVFEYSEILDPDSIGGTKSVTSSPFTIS